MKKKGFVIFCALLLTVSLACFSACDIFSQLLSPHVHDINENIWEVSEAGHWHQCSGCSQRVGFRVHAFESGKSTCSVCGWTKPGDNPTPPEENKPSPPEDNQNPPSDDKPNPPAEDDPTPPEEDNPKPPVDDNPNPPADNPVEPAAKLSDAEIATLSVSQYGYDWLGTQLNNRNLQAYYKKIDELAQQVENGTAEIEQIEVSGKYFYSAGRLETKDLSQSEVSTVYQVYVFDHPYNFWQNGQSKVVGGWSDGRNFCELIVLDQFVQHSAIQSMRKILNANINKLYAQADGAKTSYDIAAAYYVAIGKLSDYSFAAPDVPSDEFWAHGIVGLLDNDAAIGPVCEGYARVFQLMLNISNVENAFCVGLSTADGSGGGGGHAWNIVKLDDGKWYWFDLTWDDANDSTSADKTGGTVSYDYFAVSSADTVHGKKFSQTHTEGGPNSSGYFLYTLPKVSTTSFKGVGFKLGSTSTVGKFVYMRNGYNTVTLQKINSTDAVVVIDSKVTIDGKEYIVNQIGPNMVSDGVYSSVLNAGDKANRTVVIPTSVTSLALGAFCYSASFNVCYCGTEEQWQSVFFGKDAFGTTPRVYFDGDWSISEGIVVFKKK